MATRERRGRRIDEELVSIDALRQVLLSRCNCKLVDIRREQADPPDFTVMIDDEVFPAEVTSIVKGVEYAVRCRRFARDIEAKCKSSGRLKGNYVVKFFRSPSIPRPTSQERHGLIDTAVGLIHALRNSDVGSQYRLYEDDTGVIHIRKLSHSGSVLKIVLTPPAMFDIAIREQLSGQIQKAVDTKKQKLRRVGIDTRKAVLLLYDAYGYAEARDAVSAMSQVSGYDCFHSVFWAASFSDRENTTYPEEPGRGGVFLFSRNPTWHLKANVPLGS